MFILQAIYYIFPAYIANMMPVFAKRYGMPFGVSISKKWFGSHKTYRGFIFGILGAIFIAAIQAFLYQYEFFYNISLIDYRSENIFIIGFVFGFGALFGDLIKSFFKRKLDRAPGSPFVPFDQIDFIIGALLLSYWFYPISEEMMVFLLIITPFLHFITNVIGYVLQIKDRWW